MMSAQDLCLACGLCCDGTLFADVKLTSADAAQLPANPNGVAPPRMDGKRPRLPQPCFAWLDCKCSIYAHRPGHCRKFNCDLLSRIESGQVAPESGLRTIRECREKAAEVKTLLRTLGDNDEHLAITERFRNVSRRMERQPRRTPEVPRYGDLTVAMHELHCLLSKHIYPV